MQTTDLIGTGLCLTGTSLLRGGPLLLTREHDEALLLNLSGQSQDLQAIPFFPHPEQALCFGEFLEAQARKGARALRLIETAPPASLAGIPARIREGFQGTSHLALAIQLERHVQVWDPYIHQPPCTRLTTQDVLWFVRAADSAVEIRSAFEAQVEADDDFESLLRGQGEQPTRRFFELLELVLQADGVSDRDRLSWERLWDENRVEVLPAFPFLFDGGFEGQLEGPRPDEVMAGYREVLKELVRFCGSEGEPGWAARFALALDDLDVDDPEVVHPVFRLARRLGAPELFRLFRSCSRAWVFGGPDSWNDMPLAGRPDFEELSGRLLHHIKGGILATANQELEAAETT